MAGKLEFLQYCMSDLRAKKAMYKIIKYFFYSLELEFD